MNRLISRLHLLAAAAQERQIGGEIPCARGGHAFLQPLVHVVGLVLDERHAGLPVEIVAEPAALLVRYRHPQACRVSAAGAGAGTAQRGGGSLAGEPQIGIRRKPPGQREQGGHGRRGARGAQRLDRCGADILVRIVAQHGG